METYKIQMIENIGDRIKVLDQDYPLEGEVTLFDLFLFILKLMMGR